MSMASIGTAACNGSMSFPQEDLPPRSNRSTTAADDHGQINLVSLPDDVLELLFKMLPVPDRGRLACTCSRLSDVMHWPSVWRDISIRLSATPFAVYKTSSIGTMDKADFAKYSKFFRHVEIIIPYELIIRESFDLLAQLCGRRIVRNVVLTDFDAFTISHTLTCPMEQTFVNELRPNVLDLIQLLQSTTQISLILNGTRVHIMRKLYQTTVPEKCARLTRNMALTREGVSEYYLGGLLLTQSAPTEDFISIFPALHVLQMNIVNLSDQLLLELSDTLVSVEETYNPRHKQGDKRLSKVVSTMEQTHSSKSFTPSGMLCKT